MQTSLLIPPSSDRFKVFLPKPLFDNAVTRSYDTFVRSRNMVFSNMYELLHGTIMRCVPPTFAMNNIQQRIVNKVSQFDNNTQNGIFIDQRSVQETLENTVFTVSLMHTDAYLTYWYMVNMVQYFKNPSNKEDGNVGDIMLLFPDITGVSAIKILLKECKFAGVTELELDYSNVDRTLTNFDVNFDYSKFEIILNIPDIAQKEY